MSLQNLKNQKGFTIVELLIVIVVIGILAAIVIVAYNGVTQRANTSTASGNAEAVQKVAEAYNAEENGYPALADLNGWSGGITQLPEGVDVTPDVPDENSEPTDIEYKTVADGACAGYWDYVDEAVVYALVGGATTALCEA